MSVPILWVNTICGCLNTVGKFSADDIFFFFFARESFLSNVNECCMYSLELSH